MSERRYRLYAGLWVGVEGSHHRGYLQSVEHQLGEDGWRVRLSDEWSAWVPTRKIVPLDAVDWDRHTV